MDSLGHWYLVELRRRLSGEVPEEQLSGLLQEVEAHLSEAADEAVASGMSAEEADKMAVSRLGDPRLLARRYARTHSTREAQRRAAARVGWLALGVNVAAVAWGIRAGLTESLSPALFALTMVLLIAYLIASGSLRRFVAGRVFLACLAGYLAFSLALSASWYGPVHGNVGYFTTGEANRFVREWPQTQKGLREAEALVERGLLTFTPGSKPPSGGSEFGNPGRWLVPAGNRFFWLGRGREQHLDTVASWEVAVVLWGARGKDTLDSIRLQIERRVRAIGVLRTQIQLHPLADLNWALKETAPAAVLLFGLMLLVQATGWSLGAVIRLRRAAWRAIIG